MVISSDIYGQTTSDKVTESESLSPKDLNTSGFAKTVLCVDWMVLSTRIQAHPTVNEEGYYSMCVAAKESGNILILKT